MGSVCASDLATTKNNKLSFKAFNISVNVEELVFILDYQFTLSKKPCVYSRLSCAPCGIPTHPYTERVAVTGLLTEAYEEGTALVARVHQQLLSFLTGDATEIPTVMTQTSVQLD